MTLHFCCALAHSPWGCTSPPCATHTQPGHPAGSVPGTRRRTPAWLRKLESKAVSSTVRAVRAGESQVLLAHYYC